MWRFILILVSILILMLSSVVKSHHGLSPNYSVFGIDIVPIKVHLKYIEHCRIPFKKIIAKYYTSVEEINGEQYIVGNITVFENITARLVSRVVLHTCNNNTMKKVVSHSGISYCASKYLIDHVFSYFGDIVFKPGGKCYINPGFKEFKFNHDKVLHIWFGNYGPLGCVKLNIAFYSTKIQGVCFNFHAVTTRA